MKFFEFAPASDLEEYGKSSLNLINQIIDEAVKKDIPSNLLFTALSNILMRMLASQPIEVAIDFGNAVPAMVLEYKKEFED